MNGSDSNAATQVTEGECSKPPAAKRRGQGWLYQRGNVWWIQYSFRGKVYRESTHVTKRKGAVGLLRQRMGEMAQGQLTGPQMDKTTFEDLAALLLADYQLNHRKSLERAQMSLDRLREYFGDFLARDITYDRLLDYAAKRAETGRRPATIRNELAALKRAFSLAKKAGKAMPPVYPTIEVSNTRTGFFERGDFEAVRGRLPVHLQGVVTFMYLTGWRRGEVLGLRWKQVDFKAGIVRLEPGTTKNDDGREFPFALLPELEAVLNYQHERAVALGQATGAIIPWVFHRDGEPMKAFRKAWARACHEAGLHGRIPHDFRRTAVRNLERAGVSRSAAMKLTGHKTEAVYRRYAIVSKSDLAEGVQKLAALHQAEQAGPRKTVALRG
jgi:integrase